jgi:hypothetical protein
MNLPSLSPAPWSAIPSPVTGGVKIILRLEGLVVLSLAVFAYAKLHASWLMFGGLFLAPDLLLVGYLAGARTGALTYNLGHSFIGPIALILLSAGSFVVLPYALIWVAHLGFDRLAGYGLKYATAFGDTHLGRVGGKQTTST